MGELVSIGGWADGLLIGFDTETTGPDPETARIVTATVARVEPAPPGTVRDVTDLQWVVDPGIEVPEEAAKIHGYTTERVQEEGSEPRRAVPEILMALLRGWKDGGAVVIFNSAYDMTVLDRELERLGEPGLDAYGAIIDPMVIDRTCDPYRKGKRSLTDVCAHYGIHRGERHDAHDDALAAVRLAWHFSRTIELIRNTPLHGLNPLQAAWRWAWAEDFKRYLLKHNRGDEIPTVRGDWPLTPRSNRHLVPGAVSV